MDINDLRIISTVFGFVAFVSYVGWAYSGKRKQAFDEAANLPFADDELAGRDGQAGQQHN